MIPNTLIVTRRSILILALGLLVVACGSPSSSPAISPSAAVSADVPIAPSPAASPETASSSAPATEPHPIAQALVDALQSDPLITHLDQQVSATTTGGATSATVDATMTADIAGSDLSVHIALSGGGVAFDEDLVVLGDVAYLRTSARDWTSSPSAPLDSTVDDIIEDVRIVDDPESLTYVGVEAVDGRSLHRLTADGTIPYEPASGGTGVYDTFDVWVEADGSPVIVEATFSATDINGNQVTGDLTLTFSDFGGPIEIVAPEGVSAPE